MVERKTYQAPNFCTKDEEAAAENVSEKSAIEAEAETEAYTEDKAYAEVEAKAEIEAKAAAEVKVKKEAEAEPKQENPTADQESGSAQTTCRSSSGRAVPGSGSDCLKQSARI